MLYEDGQCVSLHLNMVSLIGLLVERECNCLGAYLHAQGVQLMLDVRNKDYGCFD